MKPVKGDGLNKSAEIAPIAYHFIQFDHTGKLLFVNPHTKSLLEFLDSKKAKPTFSEIFGEIKTSTTQLKSRHGKREVYWEINYTPAGISMIGTDHSNYYSDLGELLQKGPYPIIITDDQIRIQFVNQAFEILTGYSKEECFGKNPGTFLQGKETSEEARLIMREAIRNKRPFQVEILNYRKDGRKYWTEIFAQPLFDYKEKLKGFISIQPWISERKKEEENRNREILRKFLMVVKSIPDPVLVTDNDSWYIYSNPAAEKIFGFNHSEFKKMKVSDLVTQQFPAKEKWDNFKTEGYQVGEVELRKKEGGLISMRYFAIVDLVPGYHFSILSDNSDSIAERQFFKNEQLRLANQLESHYTLFMTLAHDLKSPVNTLSSFLTAYQMGAFDGVSTLHVTKQLSLHLSQVESILENLLEWSKSQIGLRKRQPSQFLVWKQVERTRLQLNTVIERNQILFVNLCEKKHKAFADPEVVQLVLRNLISNALKFTSPDKTIEISSEIDNDYLVIKVRDEGIGIPASRLDNLFEIHQTTIGIHNEKGSGLGLGLCARYIKDEGGSIGVISEEGKGSTFWFTLPLK